MLKYLVNLIILLLLIYIKEIKKYGKEAFHISDYDDIKTYLSEYVNKGDLILTLGAGYVTKLADLLVNKENE